MSEQVKTAAQKREDFGVKVGGTVGLLGMVAMGLAFGDTHLDILPGESPLESSEGGFRGILRDLREPAPELENGEPMPFSEMTIHQKITMGGAFSTMFLAFMTPAGPLKAMSVGGSGTLATLAAYEAMLLMPLGLSSGLVFFGGAAATMYGTSFAALLKEPKNPIQQAQEGIQKAKDTANKVKSRIKKS